MPYIFYKQTIITFHVLIYIIINFCHTWLLFKVFLYVLLLREKTLDLTIVFTGLTTWGLQDGLNHQLDTADIVHEMSSTYQDFGVSETVVKTAQGILIIVNIMGNFLVCVIIVKEKDMR